MSDFGKCVYGDGNGVGMWGCGDHDGDGVGMMTVMWWCGVVVWVD